ncbi:MAG: MATE family efflux transporter [Paludibacteraceae bacterium]|nr:MATE family efflux transporter [Paludibacteraceae bacterium]
MSNKPLTLGTKSIGSLLLHYSLPAIIAMTASSLYNMMDSMFIGHGIGPMALAGLSATFPFMNLGAAFGAMVGAGASTVVSVKLGQQDYKSANHAMGNVILLNVGIGLLFMMVSLLFLDPILYFFGASDNTIGYARDYMEVILAGNIITHLYLGLNSVLRSSGHPREAMNVTLLTVALNFVFNYLFVFVVHWGIRGVAIGTILAQIVGLAMVMRYFLKPTSVLQLKKEILRFSSKISGQILSIGLAPFCMNALACVVVTLINTGLQNHGGDMHVAAYGIDNRIVFFFVMMNMGFNQGMQPIAGYNYGAKKYNRVLEVFRYTMYCVLAFGTIGWLACQFMPQWIVVMFSTDTQLNALSAYGLRVLTCLLPLIGFQMVCTNLYQSIGKAKIAIFLSTTRQLLFLIPFLIILPNYWGTDGIWYSLPMADGLSALVVGVMIIKLIRELKKQPA